MHAARAVDVRLGLRGAARMRAALVPPLVSKVMHARGIPRRDGLQALGVSGHGVCRRLGVEQVRVAVDVIHGVAFGVVVLVVGNAGLAAELLRLFLRLDALGAGEQAAGGDVVLDEGLVVGAAVEGGGHELLVGDLAVVVLEEVLDLGGSRGAGHVEGGSIAVVDHESVVGRRDHVHVEVQADLGLLGRVEALNVEGAAQQAELLRGPEAEADGVLHLVLGERLGDDKVADDATAVVVDAGAGVDRVAVAAERDDVVGVAGFGLRDDVEGHTVLHLAVDHQAGFNSAVLQLRGERRAIIFGDTHDRGVFAAGVDRSAERAAHGAAFIVVHHHGSCIGSSGQYRLVSEWAGPALNECNLARHASVVGLVAADVGDHSQLGLDLDAGAVGHGLGFQLFAGDG